MFDPKECHKLDSKERYDLLKPYELLYSSGLRQGFTGADLGCGTGFFTIPASKILADEGKIYAFDIQKLMLTKLRMKIDKPNVVPILIDIAHDKEYTIPLKNKLLDFVLIAFVLHEVDNREQFIKEAKRILKDNGLVIIIEWVVKEEENGPPKNIRIEENNLIALLKSHNFAIDQFNTINSSHYLIVGHASND